MRFFIRPGTTLSAEFVDPTNESLGPAAAPASAAALSGERCFVRVTGTRADRFVEFEFAIGDPDMAVELVMQFEQFRQFCATPRRHPPERR